MVCKQTIERIMTSTAKAPKDADHTHNCSRSNNYVYSAFPTVRYRLRAFVGRSRSCVVNINFYNVAKRLWRPLFARGLASLSLFVEELLSFLLQGGRPPFPRPLGLPEQPLPSTLRRDDRPAQRDTDQT